jgi:peptide deformylase
MLEILNEDHDLLQLRMPEYSGEYGDTLKPLVAEMFTLMWVNAGIGLSANQVGMTLRMFVMGPKEGPHYVCINPEVVETSKETNRAKEGCLSYPFLWLNISRPNWVDVRYTDIEGNLVERRFAGLLARCYLHELEHLEGKNFTTLSSKLGLQLAREKQRKKKRR